MAGNSSATLEDANGNPIGGAGFEDANGNAITLVNPGKTPEERRKFIATHPAAREANIQATQAEFNAPNENQSPAGIRFLQGLVSPVTGVYHELSNYLFNTPEWVKSHGMPGLAGTPFVPGESQAGQAASGDIAGALGSGATQAGLTALAAKAAGPKAIDEPGASFESAPITKVKLSKSISPDIRIMRAVRPAPTETNFLESLAKSKPELNAIQQLTGKPITNIDDLIQATETAQKLNRVAYDSMNGPKLVNLTPVADKIIKSIPEILKHEDPDAVARVTNLANSYRGKIVSVQTLDQYIHDANAQLSSYYNKIEPGQNAARLSNEWTAATSAKVNMLRELRDKAMDEPGVGAAPRELNARWGALAKLKEAALLSRNKALTEAPGDLSHYGTLGSAIQAAHGVANVLEGNLPGAASNFFGAAGTAAVSKWIKRSAMINKQIELAFKNDARMPTAIQMPQPFTIAPPSRQITQGSIITPPPKPEPIEFNVTSGPTPQQILNSKPMIPGMSPEELEYWNSIMAEHRKAAGALPHD